MNAVRKVLIVGGGSSGWMAACLLRERLPELEIALIESSDVPVIGVGESTNTSVRYFHKLAGIDERAFMRGANAAFKIAIRFENFASRGAVFFHPFGKPVPPHATWFKPAAHAHFPSFQLASRGNLFSRKCAYSYQIDAGLYGQFLKEHCKRRQVIHLVDHVRNIEVGADGAIRAIHTESGRSLIADLYVDCSGFRSALLGDALKEPFRSVNNFLLNDRAVAARIPYVAKDEELKTYTNCTALSSGWVWQIPLWSRLGVGYVYSSAFQSESAAEEELREFLGRERVADASFNHIRIRAGRHERAWVRNCAAIGVSYGFLEPLESTGLSLTQLAILDLEKALASGATSLARHAFNQRCAQVFDTTRDFVTAHFVLTRRDDTPYWQHIRYANDIPDSLAEALMRAQSEHSFAPIESLPNTFYEKLNWNVILSGMGLFDAERAAPVRCPTPGEAALHAAVLQRTVHGGERDGEPIEEAAGHPIWAPTW